MPASPDVLRTRLKALVEEWRHTGRHSDRIRHAEAMGIFYCCDQLAALLAESEGEPCRHGKDCVECEQEREPAQDEHIHTAGWGGEPCVICGEPVGGPDCEAKAKLPLPLGHEFRQCEQPYSPPDECCCGQSRSAHEPR